MHYFIQRLGKKGKKDKQPKIISPSHQVFLSPRNAIPLSNMYFTFQQHQPECVDKIIQVRIKEPQSQFSNFYKLLQPITELSMSTNLRLQEVSFIKSNITSSLDVSPTQTYFTAITRLRDTNSSMFNYQLDLYNLQKLQKLNTTQIYSSYSQQKHFCRFLADDETIVVTTKYHIIFYDIQMNVKFKTLHELQNIYDLTSSPNGRLVVVVGDNRLLIWDAATFRTIKFSPILPQARICRFSPDSTRFVVSFTENDLGTLNFYSIIMEEGQFFFELNDKINTDVSFGSVSSIDFNPHINTQIVVGFSNVSPMIYDLLNPNIGFKKLYNLGEQPSYKDNYKQAVFLPDGQRVISSDYKDGVGLWPANPENDLIYKEDYFLFGLIPFNRGRKVIGFVWQRIKIVQIQFQCGAGTIQATENNRDLRSQCSCLTGQYWNTAQYRCSSCIQNGRNICQCFGGEVFRNDLGACVLDCSSMQSAVKSKIVLVSLPNDAKCFCQPGYFWQNGRCIFDCFQISQYAIGSSANGCVCADPLQWNDKSKTCQCPQSTVLNKFVQPQCQCDIYHYRNPNTGKCVPDCTKAEVNADTLINLQETDACPCRAGMIFTMYQLAGSGIKAEGCIQNCEALNFTIEGTPSNGCKCPENMKWENNVCRVDCSKIENAMGEVIDEKTGEISCRCPINYVWVRENLECGKDCSDFEYVNQSLYSTAISCPCIDTFAWDPINNKCKIDCDKIEFAQSYSVRNNYSCICRQTFYWDDKNLQCFINCSKIWDAVPERIGPGQCKCNNDRQFNNTGLLCQNEEDAQAVFSKPWVWVVLGLGIVFILAVFVIMFRYCKKFSSEKNKEHDKKLKKSPQKRKKRKLKPRDHVATTSQRLSLNRG